MNTWPSVRLDSIYEIARGGSPRPIDKFITDDPNGINWIMIGDATDSTKFISKTKKKILPSGVARSRVVKPGDFLLTNSMSFGRPYIMATQGCIHDGWLVLSPKSKNIDQNYFYHLLGSDVVYSEFERRAAGATVKNLNIDLVSGVEVLLPTLSEQKRIAEILDQVDSLRYLRQQSLDRVNNLSQAIFYEMFGDPSMNPKNWPLGKIDDLTLSTQYGTSGKAGAEGAYPILRMGNLSNTGKIDVSNLKYIDLLEKDIEKYTVKTGDILFNRTNSPDLVGKTAVFYRDEPFAFAGYLVRLRVNERAVPEFISAYLNCPHGKKTLRNMCKAIIGMANINAKELRTIPIMMPPIELQKKFQEKLHSLDEYYPTQKKSLDHINQLFSSLQHRAFRGEL